MKPDLRIVAAVTLILAGVASPLIARTWKDRKGRQVEAEFIAFNDETVTIKRQSDGKRFTIPLESLSDDDQEFIKSQSTAPSAAAERKAAEEKAAAEKKAAEQEAWQNDYDLFLKALDKEVQRSNPLAPFNEFDDLFKGKQIRWTLQFKGSKVEEKELKLEFDGLPTSLTIVSSEQAAPKWRKLKAGSTVSVEAKVKMAFVITLNPDGQGRGTRVGLVIFEHAKIAEETKE